MPTTRPQVVALCLWLAWIGRAWRWILLDAASPSPTAVAGARDRLALCGRDVHTLPPAPLRDDSLYSYGVRRWERNLTNAIVLENDPRKGYGRTGNQIQEFFHAFDVARDLGGALVVRESDFPVESTLRALYLGIDKNELQRRLGVAFYEDMEERQRSNLTLINAAMLYFYVPKDTSFAIEHRRYVIQELYRLTARELQLRPDSEGARAMCTSFHAFFGKDGNGQMSEATLKQLGMDNPVTQKYAVIHSRGLEREGRKMLWVAHKRFGVDDRAALEYPPDMVASILSPLGMMNSSIVMITDGQNKNVATVLKAAFGPTFQVVPQQVSTVSGDIMLAILSDVFIGNPVSTFSQYIAQARYALGIENSYLFARKGGKSGEWETFCEDEPCLYFWLHTFLTFTW